jgi:hypothetical protein
MHWTSHNMVWHRVQKDKLKNGLDKANWGEVFNGSLPLLTNWCNTSVVISVGWVPSFGSYNSDYLKLYQNWDWFLELVLEVASELEMELDKN